MKRNKAIEKLLSAIDNAKVLAEEQKQKYETIFDGKSENWQEGERGEAMQAAIEGLESAIQNLESAMSDIEDNFEE